ncbi:MAG TPA: S8 family serine peptidase [Methylocella sp.]|nr:S8 family serine peptidase [Methylocella sp.]
MGGNAIFLDKAAPQAARAAAASALEAKAASKGRLRVIAGLNVNMRPPHELSEASAAQQERSLRAAQNAAVSRALGAAAADASVSLFDALPFVAMTVTPEQLSRLLSDPSVLSIQEDVAVPPTLTQSVPFINANKVWAAGFPGTGITVAILDTGVDKTHDMFPGNKIVSEACYSSNVPGQSSSVCPGGVSSSVAAGSGVNCSLSISGCNHGTHVAGIAAGNMARSLLRGVAKDARIIAIQVFSRFNSPADCSPRPAPCVRSFTSDQIKGLERIYALRNIFTIAAANMSLGGGQFFAPCDTESPALKAAIDLLRGVRIATVIASGNDGFNGSISSPGCISSAIAVGSTLDTANVLSSFSNHSANVRLLAPGSNILSSVPPGPKTTATFDGTSMATPHVTGAFALLRDVKGLSTVDDIAAALECTGVPVTRAGITEPRIDVNAAWLYLLNPPNTTRTFTFSSAAQAASWTPFAGAWAVNAASPGTYDVTSATPRWKLSTLPNCNEDLTITTRLRRIWPAGQRSNAGIAFKTQLSSVNKTMHGYMAAINRDLPGDDHQFNVVLWRFDGVNLQTGAGPGRLLCNANLNTIKSGNFYTLKVVSHGGLHQVFIDNVLRCSATDRAYGTGRAGLITFYSATSPAGNKFQADSFIADPNETVPPGGASGELTAAAQ